MRSSCSVIAALAVALASTIAAADPPPAPDFLTEGRAFDWGAQADEAWASVFDDASRVRVGSRSLRFETDGGFDTWLWSPRARNAAWDLVAARSGGIQFWAYAENQHIGFQNQSPWIRFYSGPSDYLELRPRYDLLNDARNQWLLIRVPLSSTQDWTATRQGNPNLSRVTCLEIHADTWDYGFKLWIDGLRFDEPLQAPARQRAYIGNRQVQLRWDPVGGQGEYRIYRSTAPFQNVQGLSPIATVVDLNQSSFIDGTAANGTSYHYAVTLRLPDGFETTEVKSVGPRTPRDETDLQVLSLSRSPLYPRYDVQYRDYTVTEPSGFGPYQFSAAVGLGGGQDGQTQRWPRVGQNVTYTATLRNRGTNAWSGLLPLEWRVDGTLVRTDSRFVTLVPGATATFAYSASWDDQWHRIEARTTIADERPGNNAREIWSKSVAYLTFVDRTFIEDFREDSVNFPNAVTDDPFDWLNRHMDRFNELFELRGSPKRVHYDLLAATEDYTDDPNVNRILYAIFPFRLYAGEQSYRRGSGYYDAREDMDYALLHEQGHQLGLIDLYRLNVEEFQNQVTGQRYRTGACLMHGVSHFLSFNSAAAMTHWQHVAHGYYGQYLYRMPATLKLRVTTGARVPVSGARITVYQKVERPGQGEVITNQVKAAGTTDAAGEWTFPNVPIDPNLVPQTFAGDRLRDNPFGYLAVVGTNGTFLIKIEYEGKTEYRWLDVTEVNNLYTQGHTDVAVVERHVGAWGARQAPPPANVP